jgi:GT2 family glycosyltransferase
LTEGLKPFIVIVFPNWNGREDTLECLDSLRKLDYPKDRLEIIISDNGSTDGSIEAIKEKFTEMQNEGYFSLQIIENGKNIGAPAAYNRGLKRAKGDYKYILKLDNDVVLASDCLKTLSEYIEQDSEAGIVGPRVYSYHNPDKLAHGSGYMKWGVAKRIDFDSDKIEKVDYVTGCCALLRKEIVEKQGFFLDENYFVYGDDIDISLASKDLGYKNVFIPYTRCKHKVSESTGRKAASDFSLYHDFRGRLYMVHKYSTKLFLVLYWLTMPYISLRWFLRGWSIKVVYYALTDFLTGRLGMKGHY